MRKGKNIKCKICNTIFYAKPSHSKRRKFCSYKCMGKFRKGKHISPTTEFKKDFIPWNKNKPHSEKTKEKISIVNKGKHYSPETEFKKGQISDSKNPHWKGGKNITTRGYVRVKNRQHSFCDANGYVLEHRLIMEEHLERYLTPEEIVHHINGIKNDNRIENLQLCANESEHQKYHPFKKSYR